MPRPELLIARVRFGRLRKKLNREQILELLYEEMREAIRLVESCGDDGNRRVLIKRLRGMEDSSRYWSVYMVLEHLRIVNQGVAGIMELLGRGVVPDGRVSTADVKPKPDVDSTVIAAFQLSCEAVADAAESIADLTTATKHEHPWFGPLNAAGWFVLAAFHVRLHRGQIERIMRGLAAHN